MKISQDAGRTELELEVAPLAWDAAGAFWLLGTLNSHTLTRQIEEAGFPAEPYALAAPVRVRVRIDGFGLLALVLKALRSRGLTAKGGPIRVEVEKPKWVKRGGE